MILTRHTHHNLRLIKRAVFVHLIDDKDLVGVGAVSDQDIHAIAVSCLGAFDVAVVGLDLGFPCHAILVDAAAHGANRILDADAEAVQADRGLGVVARLVLRWRRLFEIVAGRVGRLVGLSPDGLLDLIASELRVGHAVELELLTRLAVLQEELIAAALDRLIALVGQLAQHAGALSCGGRQAWVASVGAASPGLDDRDLGRCRRCWCGLRWLRNCLLLFGRKRIGDWVRLDRRVDGSDRSLGRVDILRFHRHVGADAGARAFDGSGAWQHVVDTHCVDVHGVRVEELAHAARGQRAALLGGDLTALLAKHGQRGAGLRDLGWHHGEGRAGLCSLEHLLHLSDGLLSHVGPGARVLGDVERVEELAGGVWRQAADLLERGVAAQVGFDGRHTGGDRIDGSTRACGGVCSGAGWRHDGLISDTGGHHGTREHAAGLLSLVNDGLQRVGCRWRGCATVQRAKCCATRSGCNRFARGLTKDALHGVDVNAFVVQCDVGGVAPKAALTKFNRGFFEHTHAGASAKASGGLLASPAARQAACHRFNTRGASHQAKQAVDGNVAGVCAVVGLGARGNLGGLVGGVLAGLDELLAHRVVDAALGCTHALRSTGRTLQNESGSLGLAKARDDCHQQRRRAGAQGVQGGFDWGLQEAADVGHDLVPGTTRCLGALDGVLALLALILAVLGLAVGQRLGGVAQGLRHAVIRTKGVGQQLCAGDHARCCAEQVVRQGLAHAAVGRQWAGVAE